MAGGSVDQGRHQEGGVQRLIRNPGISASPGGKAFVEVAPLQHADLGRWRPPRGRDATSGRLPAEVPDRRHVIGRRRLEV